MASADNQIHCYLTLAQIEHVEGNLDAARAALENAKRLAATHNLWPGANEQIIACEKAIFAMPTESVTQDSLIDPLSERELEVLALLAEGLLQPGDRGKTHNQSGNGEGAFIEHLPQIGCSQSCPGRHRCPRNEFVVIINI